MVIYLDLFMVLNFLVDFLLLVCAERIAGFFPAWKRILLASGFGGIYAGFCLIPGWTFLGNFLWRALSLCGISFIAFGWNPSTLRKSSIYILMTMVLGGSVAAIQAGSFGSILGTSIAVTVLCILGFHGKTDTAQYVPIKICHQGKTYQTTALFDTGNTLRDPVSGERVLVADSKIGTQMFGISQNQLRNPIETMLHPPVKGLRLIPYCTVGNSGSMLLAIRCENVCIDQWRGSALIAFSPEQIGKGDIYQVLTGGIR